MTAPTIEKISETVQKPRLPFAPVIDAMPTLQSKYNPYIAFFVGFFFGCIGTGIYFGTWKDFYIPLLVLITLSFVIPVIGGMPGWWFAGVWAAYRVIESNNRLDRGMKPGE